VDISILNKEKHGKVDISILNKEKQWELLGEIEWETYKFYVWSIAKYGMIEQWARKPGVFFWKRSHRRRNGIVISQDVLDYANTKLVFKFYNHHLEKSLEILSNIRIEYKCH
jgi:hypothetical protein